MELEATRLTEVQRCEIIAKLSKPNAPSKHALRQEYEVNELRCPPESYGNDVN
jgi:hypothetical protein